MIRFFRKRCVHFHDRHFSPFTKKRPRSFGSGVICHSDLFVEKPFDDVKHFREELKEGIDKLGYVLHFGIFHGIIPLLFIRVYITTGIMLLCCADMNKL